MTREATNQLLQMIDDGLLPAQLVLEAALKYMTERDVADMIHQNEFFMMTDDEAEAEADEEEMRKDEGRKTRNVSGQVGHC